MSTPARKVGFGFIAFAAFHVAFAACHVAQMCIPRHAAAYEGFQEVATGSTTGCEWLSQARQHHDMECLNYWTRGHALGWRCENWYGT